MRRRVTFFGLIALITVSACTVTKEYPAASFVVTGRMNPVSGSKALSADACWVLEAGTDIRQLKYYQLIGRTQLVESLKEEDMVVTVRILSRPDTTTACPVGAVAEVLEVIEARSKKN